MDFARQIKLVGAAQIFFAVVRLLGSVVFGLLFGSIGTTGSPVGPSRYSFSVCWLAPRPGSRCRPVIAPAVGPSRTVAAAAIELIMFPLALFSVSSRYG